MAETRYALVTGGNKGIGLEICRKLASNGMTVILTSRNEKNGVEAVERLKDSGLSNLHFHQLDVTDPASISALAKFVETNFKKLDILVNNAGHLGLTINESFRDFKNGQGFLDVTDEDKDSLEGILEETYEMAETCISTNYYGTKLVTQELLPLLQLSHSARIVNITSLFAELKWIHNEKVKTELQNVECLTEEKIDEILQWFLRDFKGDKLKDNGWPTTVSAYKLSKLTINAYTRLLAKKYPNMLINCVHPGYIQTDLTRKMGPLIPEEGARAPVMVALLPDDGPSGCFFYEMHLHDF